MTTALIISELLPWHDDALIADLEHIFDEIDRTVEATAADDDFEILLIVDELVDEMLAGDTGHELSISLELDQQQAAVADTERVAEVA